jgi:hypothetical protein
MPCSFGLVQGPRCRSPCIRTCCAMAAPTLTADNHQTGCAQPFRGRRGRRPVGRRTLTTHVHHATVSRKSAGKPKRRALWARRVTPPNETGNTVHHASVGRWGRRRPVRQRPYWRELACKPHRIPAFGADRCRLRVLPNEHRTRVLTMTDIACGQGEEKFRPAARQPNTAAPRVPKS